MDRRGAFALAIALSFVAAQARASEPKSPGNEVAFDAGLALYRQGDYAGAIRAWEALLTSLGEADGYKLLYNLGLAYQAVGDVTKAVEAYLAFEARIAALPDASQPALARAADARTRRQHLTETNGAVHVQAPRRGGLVLTRVGTSEPRAAGYVVWLPPGPHEIQIFVGTAHPRTVTVNAEPGKTQEVDTTPPEIVSPPPVGVPFPTLSEPARASPWPWIGAGATLASGALPLTLFFVASSKSDSAAALGEGNTEYAAARSSYDTWRVAYYVSYALPAALAVATVISFVLQRPGGPRRSVSALSITPTAIPGGGPGGVSLSVRF
jgi:tetratricopeptide (TPR) repeat protein